MNTSVKHRVPDLSAMASIANMGMGAGRGGFVLPKNAFTLESAIPGARLRRS